MLTRILFAAMLIALPACSHYWRVEGGELKPEPISLKPKDVVPIGLEMVRKPGSRNEYLIENHTNEMVYVSFKASVMEVSGKSARVISGTQRVIHDDTDSPDAPIAPGSSADVSFFSDHNGPGNPDETIIFRIAIQRGVDKSKAEFAVLNSERMVRDRTWREERLIRLRAKGLKAIFCPEPEVDDRAHAVAIAREKYGPSASVEYERCGI